MTNDPTNKEPDEITPETQEKALVNYVESYFPEKRIRFVIYQTLGKSVKDAARLTGYTESTGYNLNSQIRNNSKLQQKIFKETEKITTDYKAQHKLALPLLWDTKMQALNDIRSGKKDMSKYLKLLRDMEQIAGVIQEEGPREQTINVDKLQVLIQNSFGNDTPESVSSNDPPIEVGYTEQS